MCNTNIRRVGDCLERVSDPYCIPVSEIIAISVSNASYWAPVKIDTLILNHHCEVKLSVSGPGSGRILC
jgi:hypothetical protein